ncbi:MAG: hypothetical protein RL023_662 [Candidatus Parcubacteria bacterium]
MKEKKLNEKKILTFMSGFLKLLNYAISHISSSSILRTSFHSPNAASLSKKFWNLSSSSTCSLQYQRPSSATIKLASSKASFVNAWHCFVISTSCSYQSLITSGNQANVSMGASRDGVLGCNPCARSISFALFA